MANTNFYLNPWLQEVVAAFKSHLSEQALRDRYWKARVKDQNLSWKDFVNNSAKRENLEDPILGVRIEDTSLPEKIKSALFDIYQKWIGGLLMIVPRKQKQETILQGTANNGSALTKGLLK